MQRGERKMVTKLFELRDRKLRENKKRGFTLVELIVVLVIIAILAALLIPALTGYINKAKEKTIVAETRQCVMAAQTLVDEEYGKLDLQEATVNVYAAISIGPDGNGKVKIPVADVAELAEVSKDHIKAATVYAGKVVMLQYESDGKTCIYEVEHTGSGTTLKYGSKATYKIQ